PTSTATAHWRSLRKPSQWNKRPKPVLPRSSRKSTAKFCVVGAGPDPSRAAAASVDTSHRPDKIETVVSRRRAGLSRLAPFNAEVAELAAAHGSGPCTRKGVGGRVPSSAPPFYTFRALRGIAIVLVACLGPSDSLSNRGVPDAPVFVAVGCNRGPLGRCSSLLPVAAACRLSTSPKRAARRDFTMLASRC